MTPDFDYAEACIPDRWMILGRMLLPFSVGHNILLERVQSPFSITGNVELADLVQAVWICERDFESGERALLNGNTFALRMFARGAEFRSMLQKNLLKKNASAFAEYVQSSLRKPHGIWKDSKAELTYAPSLMILIRDLANHYGYSRSEIMNMPMRQAVFERFAVLERDKTISWPEPWESGAE